MKFILSIVVFLFCLPCFSQRDTLNCIDSLTGHKKGYWIIYGKARPDLGFAPDAIVEEGKYVNSKKEGIWKAYYSNQNVKSEIEFKNGRPNGWFKLYYDTGQLKEEGFWKHTRYDKWVKSWRENGCLNYELTYDEKGNQNSYIYYHRTCGKKEREYNVDSSGLYINYDTSGSITYSDKIPPSKKNDEVRVNKDDWQRGLYKKEITFTSVNDSTLNRLFKEECHCKANVTDTFHTIRNLKDKITLEGSFKNNRLYNGTCYRYQNDTVLVQKAIYEKGVYRYDVFIDDYPCQSSVTLDGYHKLYNSQKQIWKDGEFKKCQLWNGKHYLYDKNGLLMRIMIYKNGRYFADGQLD